MNQQDYFILWSIYCIAAIVLLFASFFFTNFLWRWLKEPVVLIVAVVLFSPILIDPAYGQYAPAIAVLAMDILMQVGDHIAEILNMLAYRIVVVLACYFAFAIFIRWPIEIAFRRIRNKVREKKRSKQEDESCKDALLQTSKHN